MAKMTVEDTSLTAVADAIRTKGGTSDELLFPDGFVSAVQGIKSGTNYLPSFVEGNITDITADMLTGCTKIMDSAFHNFTGLTSIDLPNSVTSIGTYAFYNCTSLTSMVIPESVTDILNSAFYNCSKITTLEMKRVVPPKIASNTFNDCTALTTIIVPAGSLSAYQSATNWSAYADIMVEASE